jgi:hypothetical protein
MLDIQALCPGKCCVASNCTEIKDTRIKTSHNFYKLISMTFIKKNDMSGESRNGYESKKDEEIERC